MNMAKRNKVYFQDIDIAFGSCSFAGSVKRPLWETFNS